VQREPDSQGGEGRLSGRTAWARKVVFALSPATDTIQLAHRFGNLA
jgi:hypothetical protein